MTGSRWLALAVGAGATAIVQSSSATTALAVALVDAGVLSFRSSLGVLLGANVGTTVTVWLVSFKLTGIGAWLILLAAVVSVLPGRAPLLGKATFFFGVIFFALDLVSAGRRPLSELPTFQRAMGLAGTPWIGVAAGGAMTAIIQSSSVTTGLAVILVQPGLLPPEAAIPVVIGANVGSTSTALLAGLGLAPAARGTPVAKSPSPATAVAMAHLAFNLAMSAGFLMLRDPVVSRLERRLLPVTRVAPAQA